MSGATAQQLCDGNLGQNIFADGDFGRGMVNILTIDPGIAPGYTYQAEAATPPDGSYVITNNTAGWEFHFSTWLTLTDNSNDPFGYFMLVNASFDSGEFYTNQVTGLCENTFYEFSADIINVVRSSVPDHIFPNVSFLIDDVVVFSTGDIPQNERWNKYGFTFTTEPGQTEVKLSLRNNANGGNGNDLALDNISFRPCGPDAFINSDETVFVCEDASAPTEITADISSGNPAIIWQSSTDSLTWVDIPNATGLSVFHTDFTVGTYYYRYISANSTDEISNDFCNIISDVLAIEVLPLQYSVFDTICANAQFNLGNQMLTTSGEYTETFISSRGCDSIVDLTLTVLDEENLDFSPQIIGPSCHNGSDGSIEFILNNGLLGPYSYSLDSNPQLVNPASNLSAGDYSIEIRNRNNCLQTFDITLSNPPEFILTLPPDTIIELGESLPVELFANQSISNYTWSTSELEPYNNLENFEFIPTISQTHIATAVNENGCIAEDNFAVSITLNDLDIFIPNVIDFNSSSTNNLFTIGTKLGLIQEIHNVYIYDRWGNLVALKTNTPDLNLWDGRINGQPAVQGVYTYFLEIELIDGNIYPFSGDVLVIR